MATLEGFYTTGNSSFERAHGGSRRQVWEPDETASATSISSRKDYAELVQAALADLEHKVAAVRETMQLRMTPATVYMSQHTWAVAVAAHVYV